jgi:hypothetical protein
MRDFFFLVKIFGALQPDVRQFAIGPRAARWISRLYGSINRNADVPQKQHLPFNDDKQ